MLEGAGEGRPGDQALTCDGPKTLSLESNDVSGLLDESEVRGDSWGVGPTVDSGVAGSAADGMRIDAKVSEE